MRIALISVHTCPLATLGGKKTGGMNVYIRELSAELGRRGIEVDVFTRSQDPCVPHVNDSGLGVCARVIHVPAGPEEPLSTHDIYPFLPQFVDEVRAFVDAEGLYYDLLYSHYWLSGWVAQCLRETWDIPMIQMFHTLGLMKNRIALSHDEEEPPLRIDTERQIMRQADALIASTPAERIQLMWLYGADMQKIKVIPPGVDTQQFCPIPQDEAREKIGIPTTDRLLVFAGRIEPLKGIDTLLRSLPLVKQSLGDDGNRLCVSIIGGDLGGAEQDDAEVGRLKELREALGLAEFVTFQGSKSQETLQYYYSAAEVVIVPSHYESFGMVALEAMACGTPVVASEVGGLAYLVQDGVTGFHVPDRDPEELAGKISLLLNNPTLRREMSWSAAQYAQRYAWSRIADQIQEAYSATIREYIPMEMRNDGRKSPQSFSAPSRRDHRR
jgi:D-inositol-3-phosphate glycosyltransferase